MPCEERTFARICCSIGIALFMALGIALSIPVPILAAPAEQGEPVGEVQGASYLGGVVAISAGGGHTCALTAQGGVKCWGSNGLGQLGDGSTASSETPVDVYGLTSGVRAIAAGSGHTCALTTGGGVLCWGHNIRGQLGDGSTTTRRMPAAVWGLSSGVVAIAAGGYHTCALMGDNSIRCWGDNDDGQVGDGSAGSDRLLPTNSNNGIQRDVKAIAAGDSHTCVLTTSGAVKCWGANYDGQLGNGTSTRSLVAVAVKDLGSSVQAITTYSSHTCALMQDNGIRCWGENLSGQLGDGSNSNRFVPVSVNGLTTGVAAVSAGEGYTCALLLDGSVKCWGTNFLGQVGDGTSAGSISTPVSVRGLSTGLRAIAAGGGHTCALTAEGGVTCWGTSDVSASFAPVDVVGFGGPVATVAAGKYHTCVLTAAGGVKCWPWNERGQLGDGSGRNQWTPVDVAGLTSGVKAIVAGGEHTCALTEANGVKCWGSNSRGQLGDGTTTDRLTPVDVWGLTRDVQAIAAGENHTCALTAAGAVLCWGWNRDGQVGDGSGEDRWQPVGVRGLGSGVRAIGAGISHSCAIKDTGALLCWGNNSWGQLGDGTEVDRRTPVSVKNIANVRAVAPGDDHTCAVTMAGVAKCWGDDNVGQLGSHGGSSDTPIDVEGLNGGVEAVISGRWHSCALTTGGVKCWGEAADGEIGNGYPLDSSETPMDVFGLSTGVAAIGAGNWHNCAVTKLGSVKCWGQNNYGQLGANPGRSPAAVFDSLAKDPIIFIPGIGGSYLALGGEELWPGLSRFVGFPNPLGTWLKHIEKLTLDPKKEHYNVIPTDAIRVLDVPWAGDKDFYGSFLQQLAASGYPEYDDLNDPEKRKTEGCRIEQTNPTPYLFVFPYDWRQDNATYTVPKLADYIGCVRWFHPGKSITIIAHSMGGLIARNYMLQHPNDHGIDRLITVGTPWLGAPKALVTLETGELLDDWIQHQAIMRKEVLKEYVAYYPGAHQLLPGAAYFDLGGRPVHILSGTPFPTGLGHPEFIDFVDSRFPASSPAWTSAQFHSWEQDRETAPGLVKQYIIYGNELQEKGTIETLNYLRAEYCNGMIIGSFGPWPCISYVNYDANLGRGDDTVPLLSATRTAENISLNGRACLLQAPGDLQRHGDMYRSQDVINLILGLIHDRVPAGACNTAAEVAAAAADAPGTSGYTVVINGATLPAVSDSLGQQAIPSDDFLPLTGMPDLNLQLLTLDAYIMSLTKDRTYSITVPISSTTPTIEIRDETGGTMSRRIVYRDLALPVQASVNLVIDGGGVQPLAYDANGDGVFETPLTPAIDASGPAAGDIQAPLVTIKAQTAGDMATVTIEATDDLSGVRSVWYAETDQQYRLYRGPLTLDASQPRTIWAFAEDGVGNRSAAEMKVVGGTQYVYLPAVER